MKAERSSRVRGRKKAAGQWEAENTEEPPLKVRDSFLPLWQKQLARLPDVCETRIAIVQFAVQSRDSLPPASDTAAAMIAWYRCGEFSPTARLRD